MYVYADNAATTAMSKTAIRAMEPYYDTLYGNPSSLHSVGQRAAEALEAARSKVAACLGARPEEIYFTSGGSEADNQAIRSAALLGARKNKRHIISTAFEHHAVLHTLKKLEREGFEVTLLDVGNAGLVKAEDVAAAIREDTALVTIMYANNEVGTIQPIAEIGAVCREKGVPFHTDAVQAVGHLDIDVERDKIDMLSLSAHKFHGPKGVGALYCRKGLPLLPFIEGGAQERQPPGRHGKSGRDRGTGRCAGGGLCQPGAQRRPYLRSAGQADRRALPDPHARLNGDRTHRLPGNVSFCFEGIEGESLLLLLDAKGVAASSGSACTSGSLDPSHVLLALGLPHEIAHGSLRLSLSEYNTMEEMDHILNVVPEVVSYLRDISPVWEDLEKGVKDHVI